jgi:quinolinate synthase
MFQPPLPTDYRRLSESETQDRIRAARTALGDRLVILGHHYQRDEVVRHADFRGDSYKLCRDAASRSSAEYIVFCGVHFMAESADLLSADHQVVILPNMSAGCSLADMASDCQVANAWREMAEATDASRVMPITYINSTAGLKAFVGERGGAVCTSSNAREVLEWAFSRADKVLFFPDEHLGRNTAVRMGFDAERDMLVWDPSLPLGGHTPSDIARAAVLLWKGYCSVHMRFTLAHIELAREAHPDVRIIVHPECRREVVDAADYFGSTEFIAKTVRAAEPGTKWGVGTEVNLVKRLADEMPDKLIFCLDPIICPCGTMYRIHPANLCWALESLVRGRVVNQVSVPPQIRAPALQALERMIQITERRPAAAGGQARGSHLSQESRRRH